MNNHNIEKIKLKMETRKPVKNFVKIKTGQAAREKKKGPWLSFFATMEAILLRKN